MKVLQINTVCGIGSTGRIATDIHNILIEQGHESYIAYGRDLPKNCDNAIRIGTNFDNYTHLVKTRILDKHGFGSKQATVEFIRKVKEIDPDVIHIHNIHGYFINIEILFNYLNEVDKPVVWTLHDCWSFTGHCSHFDHIGCDRWKFGCYNCPQKKVYPKSILLDNSKNNYIKKNELFSNIPNLTIVTPSLWLANLVKQSFLQRYPITTIYNGINLKMFKPSYNDFRNEHNIADKFIILGVAYGWSYKKGLDYFIRLADDLKEDEIIVLIGLSHQQIKELPKNIIGILKTHNTKELSEIYSAADVFMNLTLEEVMGLTNVEALACGTPVITFNTGGSVECINNETGFVVEKHNYANLLQTISKVRKININLYYQSCVLRAHKNFDNIERCADYINLYKNLLS